ncbi:hypothetical protein DV738_g5648, partial [Chaetothyriales sp. CBS 135597]
MSPSSYHTRNGRTSKRGAYLNRLWYCDCDPRLPADKFQTKNGGKNHGRWFYTKRPTDPPPRLGGGSLSRASSEEFGWSSGNDEDLASALDLFETPRKHPASPPGTAGKATSLTSQVLAVLAPHNLPTATISSVTELLASYELRTAGIARGRDLTRLALKQKEDKIADLQSCVQGLEHERDMLRNAIGVL